MWMKKMRIFVLVVVLAASVSVNGRILVREDAEYGMVRNSSWSNFIKQEQSFIQLDAR